MTSIIAINRARKLAITDDGHALPISNLFDATGDETDNIYEALSAVAPLPNGEWAVIDLKQFETVALN